MSAKVLPIVIGAVGFAAATALGSPEVGVAWWKAVGTAALIGAGVGTLSLALSMAFAQKPKGISAAGNQEVPFTVFTQTGRIPVFYGTCHVGMNVIELGLLEYKQINREGELPEQHLNAEFVASLGEGPCREAIALYADDEWQPPSKWSFTPGDENESPFPFFEDFKSTDVNPSHKWLSKIHFKGDLGNRSDLPDFSCDLRGRYPEVSADGTLTLAFTPGVVMLDGPSNSLAVLPLTAPAALFTVPLPTGEAQVSEVKAAYFPGGILPQWVWKVGLIDAVVAQDPSNPRSFLFGSADSTTTEWESVRVAAAYDRPIEFAYLDDKCARLHTLHRRGDRWYIRVLSLLTLDQLQYVIPSNVPIASITAFTFKPEDNRYYFVVGGVISTLSAYDIITSEWVDICTIEDPDVVGVAKIGIYCWLFYESESIPIDTSDGSTGSPSPLSDFIDQEEADRLGASAKFTNVTQSSSRYLGVALVRNDIDEWTASCFDGPRAPGEPYARRVEFRRYATWGGSPGRRIDKPGANTSVPFRDQSWITTGLPAPSTSAAAMIAAGADYKTTGPAPGVPTTLAVHPGIVTFTSHRQVGFQQLGLGTMRVIFVIDPASFTLGYWRFWMLFDPSFYERQTPPPDETASLMVSSPQSESIGFGIFHSVMLQFQTGGLYIRGPLTAGNEGAFHQIPGLLPPASPFDVPAIGTYLYYFGTAMANLSPARAQSIWYPPQTGGWSRGGQILHTVSDATFNSVPAPIVTRFPRDVPLLQFITTTKSGDAAAREIAAAIKEADADDLTVFSTRVTVTGLTADNVEHQVIQAGEWASWNGSTIVSAQDGKASITSIKLNATSVRHNWWQSMVTPASESVDMITNTRYGGGYGLERVNLPTYMSLHGFSLEYVRVADKKIRRYLWNHAVTDSGNIHDFLDTVLTPALGYSLTPDGIFSCAFENSSTQPVMEFDSSLIKAGSFSVAPKSMRTMANRVRINFWNAEESRDDQVTVDDEFDQAYTGSVREKLLDVRVATNPDRVAYMARNILESPQTDRQVFAWTSGAFARILSPGEIVSLSHPLGHFSRKPVRLVTVQDLGNEVQLEAQEISAYTVDGARFTAFRSPKGSGTRTAPIGSVRDSSIERFYGRALMPFRPITMQDNGALLLLGAKAPASLATAVASSIVPTIGRSFDLMASSPPRSVAMAASVSGLTTTLAYTGLYSAGLVPSLPAKGVLVKRNTIGVAVSEELVSVTAFGTPGDFTNPEATANVTIIRNDNTMLALETAAPAKVYLSTEDTASDDALEPLGADGEELSAIHWQNPGVWTDATGASTPIFTRNKDFLVIGVSSGFIPNAIKFVLSRGATTGQSLVFEYSSGFDDDSPLGVWRPLAVLDGTRGMTQSGRVHFEIPPLWSSSAAWDRHGNTIGRLTSPEAMLWIRIQRRSTVDGGAIVGSIAVENLPFLVLVPDSPANMVPPSSTAGQSLVCRFSPTSTFPSDPLIDYPGNSFVSAGGAPNLPQVTYLKATINGVESELVAGDTLVMTAGHDVVFDFSYASRTSGWGQVALGTDTWGSSTDPSITGIIFDVISLAGALLRTKTVAAPTQTVTYTNAERATDGNVDVYIRFRQTGNVAADSLQILGDVP